MAQESLFREGEVLFGGIPIRKLGIARYRAQLAAVMQDDQPFAWPIADNICFFDPQPNWELIGAVAATAAIHADIAAMPMGYQTLVGDMGSSLSGGQRQRVILARALCRRPKLLVLDEATSHLDVERERLVNAAIQQIWITRVVIAHPRRNDGGGRTSDRAKSRENRTHREQTTPTYPRRW